jgi:hypothetical protein
MSVSSLDRSATTAPSLADIKDLALKTETLEIKKRDKSNTPNLMVNPFEENQDVDALYQGQRYRGTNRGGF